MATRRASLSHQLYDEELSTRENQPLSATERQTLLRLQQRALLTDATMPRYPGLSATDPAIMGHNMFPPQRKRAYDTAMQTPSMSRTNSNGLQSATGQLSARQRPSIPIPQVSFNTQMLEPTWPLSTSAQLMNMPSKLCADQCISYHPEDFVSSSLDLPYSPAAKRSRRSSFLTPSQISPPQSFVSGQNSSFSSSYLTDPSSAPSPLQCATSFRDEPWLLKGNQPGLGMSRQPSIASSTGLSRGLEQMSMRRSGSNASQAFSNTDRMFELDDFSQAALVPGRLFNSADAGRTAVAEQETSSLDTLCAEVLPQDLAIIDQNPHEHQRRMQLEDLEQQYGDAPDDSQLVAVSMSRTGSNNSASSTASRASERRQRQIQNGKRQPLVSKNELGSSSKARAATKKSEKQAITRVTRPRQRPRKHVCTQCDPPADFHGAHELRRHEDRAHPGSRQVVWVCEQPADQDHPARPLDKCKACTDGRKYNAYYNAAAHIRRAHFFPRPRGRRPRGELRPSRAGKAGGDEPRIGLLKNQGWIKPITIFVSSQDQPQSSAMAATGSGYDDEVEGLYEETAFTEACASSSNHVQQSWPQDFDIGAIDEQDSLLDSIVWDDVATQQNFIGAGMSLAEPLAIDEQLEEDILGLAFDNGRAL
ncbi:hypothetical protein AMS68_003704 [Peltaster fructicola]|uniref:DUF7896 domain-containing protein n=1 Tax=Peltaster fructicola TaxID=286661 RepID=A0A6H0XTT9_9PEZI|nr:hypothetical protein AMS68_003704 [Peltaster fructicola]